jgi:uncharacterized protein (DUF1778 family)
MPKKISPLALRISDDLKDALVRAAAADQRSVASFVQVILRKHLEDASFLQPLTEPPPARKRGSRS